MNKKFSKRKLQGLETKRRLMNCAITLFRQKGYHHVTVDEIIEQAGSSKGGFYTHFSSKEELLYNLVGMLDEAYLKFLNLDLTGQSTREKISLFVQYVFKTIEEGIGLDFITVIYSAQIKDMAPQKFAVTPERKYYQILEKFINEGKAKKEIQHDLSAEYAIRVLTTGIRGVIYDWCLSSGEFSLVQYGSEFIIMLLHQVLPTPQ
jgi:TetR/AcrR family transcriptional regulator, fatty acid metabolism regulator protein